jgi:hypothetical protein
MLMHNGEIKPPVRQNLVKKYRPIGPGAIAGAVAAMTIRKPARGRRAPSEVSRASHH